MQRDNKQLVLLYFPNACHFSYRKTNGEIRHQIIDRGAHHEQKIRQNKIYRQDFRTC